MRDLWAFLLQTLTASGAALLLLVVKAMFRDKLSPRWQFGVWGVLGLTLLMPAGLFGRFALVNWPVAVETLKSLLTGDYSLTRVILPIPLLTRLPRSVWDWLFVVYAAGVLVMLFRHLLSYLRLRAALRRGTPAEEGRVRAVAEIYALPTCPAVEVEGLASAFICGVFRPVLVLPAGMETDEKVILHELLHLKHRDAAWSVVICLLRCIHWCNPLLWYCADRAGNDLEARCDQRVLERLEGEERRDYGRILLSMANEKYARTAGTTSVANGGRNIRRRIEAIARFKRYPAGMALVSVCIALMLAAPLVIGSRASSVYDLESSRPSTAEVELALASARTSWCTTPAGALDTYGKALLRQNGVWRAMCAPLSMQEEIAATMTRRAEEGRWPLWGDEPISWKDRAETYYIYNVREVEGGYEAVMVLELADPAGDWDGMSGVKFLGQTVRVEQEGGRWAVIPLEALTPSEGGLSWGYNNLPAGTYAAEAAGFRVRVCTQVQYTTDGMEMSEPVPNGEFRRISYHQWVDFTWLGDEAGKDHIHALGISFHPAKDGEARPDLSGMGASGSSEWNSDGLSYTGIRLQEGWESPVVKLGGGYAMPYELSDDPLPDYYAANFYINGERVAELDLRLPERGTP